MEMGGFDDDDERKKEVMEKTACLFGLLGWKKRVGASSRQFKIWSIS